MVGPEAAPRAPYAGPGSAPLAYAPPSMPAAAMPGAPPAAPLAHAPPAMPAAAMPGAPPAAYTPPWPTAPALGAGSPAPAAGPPVAAARRKAAIIAIAGVIASGAGIGALVLTHRGPAVVVPTPEPVRVAESAGATPPAAASAQAAVEPPARPDPWAPPPPDSPGPSPGPRATKPSPTASASGQKRSIGQGVQLVIPAGFQIAAKDNLVVATNPRGVLIAGGPIVIASNDPKELAQYHAKVNHLVFDTMSTVPVGGVQRPAAVFHATFAGVAVFHIVVELIGPKYRVAVAFQFPAALAKDAATQRIVEDLFQRGILLP
jgi:hypothetical protein